TPKSNASKPFLRLTPAGCSIIMIRVYSNRPPVSMKFSMPIEEVTRARGWICLLLSTLASLSGASRPPISFADQLYPVLEKAGCRICHNPEGVASPTRLRFPEEGAEKAQLEAFGQSLVLLVDRQDPENSILLKKPTNRVP